MSAISERRDALTRLAPLSYFCGEADGPCKFLIVQGVGVYDFVPVGG
jgi:hypothetical protein